MHSFAASVQSLFASIMLLHSFPRSLIRMSMQLTSSDSDTYREYVGLKSTHQDASTVLFDRAPSMRASHKAVCINAMSVALLDSGISARATIVATCVVMLRHPDQASESEGWVS